MRWNQEYTHVQFRHWPLITQEHHIDYNESKIGDIALALMYISRVDGNTAWKGYDWSITDRLHTKGLITNPVSKTKSMYITNEDLDKAKQLAKNIFVLNKRH